MKSSFFAALLLMNVVSASAVISAAQAQGTKTPPPNAIVVEETKTVEVAPKKPAAPAKGVTKKVTAGKNSFITTTTTTTEVPAAPAAPARNNYPQQSYSAPVVSPPVNTAPAPTTSSAPAPLAAPGTATTTAAAAPAPEKSRFNAVYFGEYFGPRFSNFDLSRTSGPRDNPAVDPTKAVYTVIDHSVKLWYQVAKNNKIGVQIRGRTPLDPEKEFYFKNLRLMGTWKNMIDTADINMGSQLDIELPTRAKDREAGKLLDLNFKFNWEIKTALRNWSFSAMTLIRPSFYNDPTNKSDVYFGLFPWITMDFAPSWQLIFEGSFDASHQYQSIAFDLNTTEGADDPDFIRTGVGYTINSNLQINPSIQWYTSDISFEAAVLYLSLTASI